MRVVCDTSPLILLSKIRRLALLTELYDEVIIPSSVLDEVGAKPGKEAERIRALLQSPKFHSRRAMKRILERLPPDLGRGEREAIALALETKADLVVLDDRQGRRLACEKGLSVTGTVGILIESRERGIIPSVRRELDRLVEAGMWIDEMFYHGILQGLGE